MQLPAKRIHSVNRCRLIIRSEKSKIVPGVVMQKCPVGMRPLAFDIRKERSTHLAHRRDAEDTRISNRLPLRQRQRTLQIGNDVGSDLPAPTPRLLNAPTQAALD